jgi:hypothetical protein
MEPSQLRRTENPDLGPSAPRPFYGEAEKPQITLKNTAPKTLFAIGLMSQAKLNAKNSMPLTTA